MIGIGLRLIMIIGCLRLRVIEGGIVLFLFVHCYFLCKMLFQSRSKQRNDGAGKAECKRSYSLQRDVRRPGTQWVMLLRKNNIISLNILVEHYLQQ